MSRSWAEIRTTLRRWVILLPVASALGGCSGSSLPELPKLSDLNPFAEPETKLPGKRVPVVATSSAVGAADLAPADRPVSIDAPSAVAGWTQPGGVATNAIGNVAFSGTARRVWRVSAGSGSTGRAKITSAPVILGDRVFVLDAKSAVSAFSVTNGSRSWTVSLVPENETAGEGYGGGLAIIDGRVIATTGYGTAFALDPANGRKFWDVNVRVPLRASPTAADGQIFVVGTDGRAFSLSSADGSELWSFRGLPQQTSIISNPSPAYANGIVVFPFPTGDLVAIDASSGQPIWTDTLASTRIAALGALSDAARPVIHAGRVYGIGHSGRIIASDLKTGERFWAHSIPGVQPPAVSGKTLFVVDLQGQLAALDIDSGQAKWAMKLPGGGSWSGPTLAGGRLWLTSSQGILLGVDAITGTVATRTEVGAPSYFAPVVVNGRMFILTDAADLLAFD